MWFRALLLFIVWLLVFQIVFRVLRWLLRSGVGRGKKAAGDAADAPRTGVLPRWRPSDVIDVPFRDAPAPPAPGGGDTAGTDGGEAPQAAPGPGRPAAGEGPGASGPPDGSS